MMKMGSSAGARPAARCSSGRAGRRLGEGERVRGAAEEWLRRRRANLGEVAQEDDWGYAGNGRGILEVETAQVDRTALTLLTLGRLVVTTEPHVGRVGSVAHRGTVTRTARLGGTRGHDDREAA